MTGQSPVLMRCERCRAVISNAEAKSVVRHGVPCGVCGGTLTLCGNSRNDAGAAGPSAAPADGEHDAPHAPSAARRLRRERGAGRQPGVGAAGGSQPKSSR
jgi:hypothetical protein